MRRALALLLATAACGDRVLTSDGAMTETTSTHNTTASPALTTGEPTTVAATTDEPTTGAPAATCSCAAYFDHEGCGDDELWPQVADCEQPQICPTVTVACPRPGQDLYFCQSELVIDAEALDCALAAMRDRTPGRFIIEGSDDGIFSNPPVYAVRLTGGDQAVTTSCQSTDNGTSWDARASKLAAPAFFSDCLALPNLLVRHACALAGLQDPASLPLCGA